MSEPKKFTKKLRGGPVIEVDPQILRWRQKMRKKEILLGRAMRKQKKIMEIQREERELDGDVTKKKFFG